MLCSFLTLSNIYKKLILNYLYDIILYNEVNNMLYRFFLSKKGFTLPELLMVIAVLGILVAVAVPVFTSGFSAQAKKDCANQRQVISTAFKETLGGMMDNGKAQKKVDFAYCDPAHMTVYEADAVSGNGDDAYNGKSCFLLTNDDAQAVTIGDIRGGYRQDYGAYTDDADGYSLGCDDGHYLKKKALDEDPFYKVLYNEEIPVCPLADFENVVTDDDYYYYIFEDGTVLCSCPDCHEK